MTAPKVPPKRPRDPELVIDMIHGMLADVEHNPLNSGKDEREIMAEARELLRDYTAERDAYIEYGMRQSNPDRVPPRDEPPHCMYPRWGGQDDPLFPGMDMDAYWVCCHGGSNCGACHINPKGCTPYPEGETGARA